MEWKKLSEQTEASDFKATVKKNPALSSKAGSHTLGHFLHKETKTREAFEKGKWRGEVSNMEISLFKRREEKCPMWEKTEEDISIVKEKLEGCILRKRKGCPRKVLLRANDGELLNSSYLDSEGFISMFTKEDFFVDLNTICKEQVMGANGKQTSLQGIGEFIIQCILCTLMMTCPLQVSLDTKFLNDSLAERKGHNS